MKLDALIDELTEELTPVRPRRLWAELLSVALIGAVELALLFALGIAHLDLGRLARQPTLGWRLVSLGAIALMSGFLAVRSFDPAYSTKGALRWLAVIVAVCLADGLVLYGPPAETASLLQRLDWHSGIQCAAKIVLLSLPPLAALAMLCRRGAPSDLRRTPLLSGLAAATSGAFVFVFACPFDDPLYIVVWYGIACSLVTFTARLLMPRVARW
jgi:hypothetical protein